MTRQHLMRTAGTAVLAALVALFIVPALLQMPDASMDAGMCIAHCLTTALAVHAQTSAPVVLVFFLAALAVFVCTVAPRDTGIGWTPLSAAPPLQRLLGVATVNLRE